MKLYTHGTVESVYEFDGTVTVIVEDEYTDETPYRLDFHSPEDAIAFAAKVMAAASKAQAPRCCCER
ncbi:hypothetical protein [Streptomyces lydicus]|uniref:hypothetical protein n=1 Tax=Streptomyces lydicus TaxID=47763 RepID=UPI003787E417